MRQRPENSNPAHEDPETTLVAPRFDEADARRANPVVPLAAAPYPNAPRAPRRSWTNALLAVALLAVAALGGALVTKLMQGPRAEQVQEQTRTQTEQTQAAPARAAEAPGPPAPARATAEAPREDATVARRETRDARTRRERADAALAAAEPVRDEVDYDRDRERREKREEKRRERAEKRREREDEVEKEIHKALKRANVKAPRLVDVLTPP